MVYKIKYNSTVVDTGPPSGTRLIRERSLFMARGGDIKFECKQLEGGGKISVHSFRGGGQNFSAQTSQSHLATTKNTLKIFGASGTAPIIPYTIDIFPKNIEC